MFLIQCGSVMRGRDTYAFDWGVLFKNSNALAFQFLCLCGVPQGESLRVFEKIHSALCLFPLKY